MRPPAAVCGGMSENRLIPLSSVYRQMLSAVLPPMKEYINTKPET